MDSLRVQLLVNHDTNEIQGIYLLDPEREEHLFLSYRYFDLEYTLKEIRKHVHSDHIHRKQFTDTYEGENWYRFNLDDGTIIGFHVD